MSKYLLFLTLFFVLLHAPALAADQAPSLNVAGAVNQSVALSVDDLRNLHSVTVQGNGVMRDGAFRGVFAYRGVPLRTLLQMAGVHKTDATFSKPVDLAVLAESEDGRQVAMSWGEIFFQAHKPIIVATSAEPILPKKDCSSCHEPETFKPRLQEYERDIGFPKLVVPADTYADRYLEHLSSLRVVELEPPEGDREAKLYSGSVTVEGDVANPGAVRDTSGMERERVRAVHLGEGRGYHGIDTFSGYPLQRFLQAAEPRADVASVFLVRAPDGYQALFSYGEVYLRDPGDGLLLADRENGKDLKKGGELCLVAPADKMADRWVKAVRTIKILSLSGQETGDGEADAGGTGKEAVGRVGSKGEAFSALPRGLERRAWPGMHGCSGGVPWSTSGERGRAVAGKDLDSGSSPE
jgi:DMSO/TMAO reductase YedYZ molybdopterin-dependent catalytic subunit